MQTNQLQKPESSVSPATSPIASLALPPSKKTNRLTRIFGRFKKNKTSVAPSTPLRSAAPSPEDRPNPATQGYISQSYVRERRNHTLTEADLKKHTASLDTALGVDWPRRHHSPYRSVHALLVCWPDTDSPQPPALPPPSSPPRALTSPTPLRLSSDSGPVPFEATPRTPSGSIDHAETRSTFVVAAYQLADVLKRRYDIQSQVWKVPSMDNAQEMLAWKTKDFVDQYGGPDNLLIFWYGGKAEFGSTGRPTSPNSPDGTRMVSEVIWYGVKGRPGIPARTATKALSLARADVLMLNDSPYAQHIYNSQINGGPRSFEVLGSGSLDANRVTPCFTRTLTLMLDSPHLSARGVSVPQLHRKLLDIAADSVYHHSSTTMEYPPSPSSPSSPCSCSCSAMQLATAANRQAAKITFLPIYPVYIQMAQSSPHEQHEGERHIFISRRVTSLAEEGKYPRNTGEPGVVLHFKLARNGLNVRRWKDWILSAPEEAREVGVRAVGKGDKLIGSGYVIH